MSYQPPQNFPFLPQLPRPESSPYLGEQLPTIPRLEELNMSQFGEASVQTKRKSRNSKNSKNSKSQMVAQEETTQNQSLLLRDSHADDRNTMKSMPLRNPYNTQRDRFANSQIVRYSQCDQELFSQKEYEPRPFNHHDVFGLGSPPHRLVNESASSYLPSSNSSQSQQRLSKQSRHTHSKQSNRSQSKRSNNSKHSHHSSSRRHSVMPN